VEGCCECGDEDSGSIKCCHVLTKMHSFGKGGGLDKGSAKGNGRSNAEQQMGILTTRNRGHLNIFRSDILTGTSKDLPVGYPYWHLKRSSGRIRLLAPQRILRSDTLTGTSKDLPAGYAYWHLKGPSGRILLLAPQRIFRSDTLIGTSRDHPAGYPYRHLKGPSGRILLLAPQRIFRSDTLTGTSKGRIQKVNHFTIFITITERLYIHIHISAVTKQTLSKQGGTSNERSPFLGRVTFLR
jgi:hypothetical protein